MSKQPVQEAKVHTLLEEERCARVAPTVGADGDVTTIALPGGLTMLFTGQAVIFPAGVQLQRRGIPPNAPAAPRLADLRSGRDAVLEMALRPARTFVPAAIRKQEKELGGSQVWCRSGTAGIRRTVTRDPSTVA